VLTLWPVQHKLWIADALNRRAPHVRFGDRTSEKLTALASLTPSHPFKER